MLLRDLGDKKWECLAKPGRKLQEGQEVLFGDGELTATVVKVQDDGNRVVEFHYEGIFLEVLERLGKMPLPPRFTFGYWWSRYWAYTDRELRNLVDKFHAYDIPLDVLVIDMDWHYT